MTSYPANARKRSINVVSFLITDRSCTVRQARVFVYALITVQILQGAMHTPYGFVKSYWLIDIARASCVEE